MNPGKDADRHKGALLRVRNFHARFRAGEALRDAIDPYLAQEKRRT